MKKISFKIQITLFILLIINNISYSSQLDKVAKSYSHNMQKISPTLTAVITNKDKGLAHYYIIYKQSMLAMQGIKYFGEQYKWEAGKRPKFNEFNGLPSGHTTSAWISAAYMRTFSKNYKYLAVPLYASAIAMGYSRVKGKHHTIPQVAAGALLAETIIYANSKLNWSKNYSPIDISISNKSGGLNFNFNF